MNISEVRVRTINNNKSLIGVASITFDDEIVIHDIKIIAREGAPLIVFPTRKAGNKILSVVHPINQETRLKLEDIILKAFEEEKSKIPAS